MFVTAALLPGAAVFVPEAHACSLYQPRSPIEFVADSEIIVIGEVVSSDETALVLQPEAFLKGPASAEQMRLVPDRSDCPRANLNRGDRALVYLFRASEPRIPLTNEAYLLKDGRATMEGSSPLSEVEVVSQIRQITGQYAVPAATESDGAGIDWNSTVLPLGLVLLIVFGIGLVLMRVWHRIDPS